MIEEALTQAIAIQEKLKALNGDLSGVAKNMPRDDLQRQVVEHCATIATLDSKMEDLFSTLKFAKNDQDVQRDGQ